MCADQCFIPQLVLLLEKAPTSNNIFVVITGIFVMIVEIDKKVMFHNVLFIEYNLCHGKYSRKVSFIPSLCYFKIFKTKKVLTNN